MTFCFYFEMHRLRSGAFMDAVSTGSVDIKFDNL